ncbi:MAG TPA: ribosome small subunit-dependent GTPase A [Phycisphaerae bacterium]|nr:ribosome small subunit-dependent GTPase A [Phycisphaerae bacterium]
MSRPAKKNGRKVRVPFRRNRARPRRVKDWIRQVSDADQGLDTLASESVVAKGDLSRQRTVIVPKDGAESAPSHRGTVVAVRGLVAEVDDGSRIWVCTLRRVLKTRVIARHHPIAAGDRVAFTVESDKDGVTREGVIESVAPRHGELKRRVGRRDRTIATNVDQVIIVTSTEMPPPKPHLIDRYLLATLAGGMRPVICMNKIDLEEGAEVGRIVRLYESLGYPTLRTCAISGAGVDRFREVLRDKASVVAGQSGVGKSSLLNMVQPGLKLRVGDIIEQTTKGRHTTSTAQLLRLDFGGYVVDTPGVKSFDVACVPLAEIEMHFVEFSERLANCRFPDCTHIHEPDCAIQAAVEAGDIDAGRYESYVRIFQERAG